jgi:hypothetical protein
MFLEFLLSHEGRCSLPGRGAFSEGDQASSRTLLRRDRNKIVQPMNLPYRSLNVAEQSQATLRWAIPKAEHIQDHARSCRRNWNTERISGESTGSRSVLTFGRALSKRSRTFKTHPALRTSAAWLWFLDQATRERGSGSVLVWARCGLPRSSNRSRRKVRRSLRILRLRFTWSSSLARL